ncbi:MAG: LAGLIDADG family homing endonuclease [Candidatus Aenigmarchaeota archaeon]|nr:LAGLIDADG family homing endonuclease [Candidatus Aenigmarchaeota archaeon]
MHNDELYLISALRDGNVDYRIGKNYEIKIWQKDERWLTDVLKPIIERRFHCTVHVHGHLLRITNKRVVDDIRRLSGIKPWGWHTPAPVKLLPPSRRITYIRGFWDAEGGVPKHPERCHRAEQRYLSFHQKDREPLVFIRDTLISLGYRPTNITYCKGAHEFRITRAAHIVRFCREIGSLHPEKGERMRRLVKKIS